MNTEWGAIEEHSERTWDAFQDQSELLTRAIDDSLIKTDLLKQEKPFKQYEEPRKNDEESEIWHHNKVKSHGDVMT